MMSFNSAQLYEWIAGFLWPMFRLLALIGTAPVFSDVSVPRPAKIGLAALAAIAISPTIETLPVVPVYSFDGLLLILNEIGIGIAMGFTMRLVFAAVEYAGEIVGLQMGLSFASFFDPHSGGNTMVLGRFFNIVAMLLFLAMDGHLMMLATVADSFSSLPISGTPLSADGWLWVARAGGTVFSSGLLLALPLVAALLTLNLVMGILNRASPQLSIFAVGFPVTLAGGMLMMLLVMPHMNAYMGRLIEMGLASLATVLGQLAR